MDDNLIDKNELQRMELMKRLYDQEIADAAERVKYATEFAQSGLRALMLVNGGAIIGLFTFIGNAERMTFDMLSLWRAFAWFVVGIIANLISYVLAHSSQNLFYLASTYHAQNISLEMSDFQPRYDPDRPNNIGNWLQKSAVVAAVLSLIFFCVGSGYALYGVS